MCRRGRQVQHARAVLTIGGDGGALRRRGDDGSKLGDGADAQHTASVQLGLTPPGHGQLDHDVGVRCPCRGSTADRPLRLVMCTARDERECQRCI